MKRTLLNLTLIALIVFAVATTGCKKSKQTPAPSIADRWILLNSTSIITYPASPSSNETTKYVGDENNDFFYFYGIGHGDMSIKSPVTGFDWSVANNKVTLTYNKDHIDVYDIVVLTETSLQLHSVKSTGNSTIDLTLNFKRSQHVD